MKLRTEINSTPILNPISYRDKIMSFGSCFSSEIGQKLQNLKYAICLNPSGITFNASSIHNTIMRIKESNSLPEDELIFNGSTWCHIDFHGSFNSVNKTTIYNNINQSILDARKFVLESKYIIFTLGTAFVYEDIKKERIVNNCHKLPPTRFRKRLLEVDEIVTSLEHSMSILQSLSKNELNYIITLSPIRHKKEGLHQNQISKATCLLALEKIAKNRKDVYYFQSYEILLDDLRDYRFYKEDMIHPSQQALNYIYDIFERDVLNVEEQELRNRISKINQSLNHKPLFPESESHQSFLRKLENEIKQIEKTYRFIRFN